MKTPLLEIHPAWKKTSLGDVRCLSCGWIGAFTSLLAEGSSRRLYCPLCTSTKWNYFDRNSHKPKETPTP